MPPTSSETPASALRPYEPRALNPLDVRPRKTAFAFAPSIEKHWISSSPVKTHFFNAINLFVVPFEDFMVRVMRDRLDQIHNPELRRQIRGFMGQEATHARAHEKFLQNLAEQGYRLTDFQRFAEYIFATVLEKKLGSTVSIAAIAGFEHLTALLAEIVLTDGLLAEAAPPMRHLWEWHAAEELEHKALAFELLQAVSPSYPLRAGGALLGAGIVACFIGGGMLKLLHEDRVLSHGRTLRDLVELAFTKHRLVPLSLRIFLQYFKPGFHPRQRDTAHLADQVFRAEEPTHAAPPGV